MLNNNKNLMCEFAEELVSYLYEELSDADKARFEMHLSDCSPCTDELAEFTLARSAVQEWRDEEFLPLPTPIIEIPYEQKVVQLNPESVSRSWLAAVRDFFTLSPAWTTTATALAALVICVGLFLTMFSSLPEDKDVVVQTKEPNVKVSPSPTTTGTPNANSNVPDSIITEPKPDNLPKSPVKNPPTQIVAEPIKGSTIKQPQNQNIKKPVQPNKRTPTNKPLQKAPRLLEEDEDDDSLRLSDLLEGIGTDD